MNGKGNIRFNELFADTVNCHGIVFAFDYYCGKHGMPVWEFIFWRKLMVMGNGVNKGIK